MSVLPAREPRPQRLLRRGRYSLPALALLALLLLAGCSSASAVTASHPSPAVAATLGPTATLAPLVSAPLSWQPTATLPTSQRPAYVALSDGRVAYLCQPSDDDLSGATAAGSPAQVWRTSDRGAHWQPQASVPVTVDRNECQIVVDALDPNVAVAVLNYRSRGSGGGGGGDPTTYLNYATEDGGATWRALPSSPPYAMTQLATRNGTAYALRMVLNGNAVTTHLWTSTDDLRTWTELGNQIPTDLDDLWLNPANGALLVDGTDFEQSHTLWKSTDGGHTFTKLPLTVTHGFVAQIPTGASDWTICTTSYDVQPLTNQSNALTCSTDGGATWRTRSDESMVQLPIDGFVYWLQIFAIAPDGSLLATFGQGDTPALYRLPAGATAWLSLGSTNPYATVLYGSGSGNGIIWQSTSALLTALVP